MIKQNIKDKTMEWFPCTALKNKQTSGKLTSQERPTSLQNHITDGFIQKLKYWYYKKKKVCQNRRKINININKIYYLENIPNGSNTHNKFTEPMIHYSVFRSQSK